MIVTNIMITSLKNIKNKKNDDGCSVIRYKNTSMYLDLKSGLNIYYTNKFIDQKESDEIFKLLETELKYNSAEESKVLIHGKYIEVPRSQTAYGEPGTYYKFAGSTVKPRSWLEDGAIEALLRNLAHKLGLYANCKFNFVLINRYENGDQYIGFHSDSEELLGPEPKIAGLSLGSTRPLYFQNKITGITDIKINLESGSVVLMNHPTNVHWKHSIPKTSKKIGPRISLTFRKMFI